MSIFKDNKKGQLAGKGVQKFTNVIIGIAVLFFVASAIVPVAQTGGAELGDSARCFSSGGFFNDSQSLCLNGTGPADTGSVGFDSIPLSNLFVSGGIVFILIAVFLFNSAIKRTGGK